MKYGDETFDAVHGVATTVRESIEIWPHGATVKILCIAEESTSYGRIELLKKGPSGGYRLVRDHLSSELKPEEWVVICHRETSTDRTGIALNSGAIIRDADCLPEPMSGREVFHGYFSVAGVGADFEFSTPLNATTAEKDASYLAALLAALPENVDAGYIGWPALSEA